LTANDQSVQLLQEKKSFQTSNFNLLAFLQENKTSKSSRIQLMVYTSNSKAQNSSSAEGNKNITTGVPNSDLVHINGWKCKTCPR